MVIARVHFCKQGKFLQKKTLKVKRLNRHSHKICTMEKSSSTSTEEREKQNINYNKTDNHENGFCHFPHFYYRVQKVECKWSLLH